MAFCETTSKSCPLCGKSESLIFFKLTNVPCSCNILWRTREDAINCPKGDIELGYCPSCTFISNYALEPAKNQYTDSYDNSLFYSSLFQGYVEKTVKELIQKYNLHNKTIMEITVGKVDFLSLFCSLGPNKGVRFDSSKVNAEHNLEKFELLKPQEKVPLKINFVFSFHDLEHANDPRYFLNVLKKIIDKDPNTIFYFSVPNIYKAFSNGDFTDIIYEHVSYFTVPSLHFLFSALGYKVLNIFEDASGLYSSINIVATISTDPKNHVMPISEKESDAIKALCMLFSSKSRTVMEKTVLQLKQLLGQGKKLVIWGAGARGVTFLNIFRDDRIKYVVDINPKKQGNFIPGTGQKIISPSFLLDYKPNYVIIVNALYENEIKKTLEKIGVNSKILSVFG
jgi:hypothetical protein